MIRASFQKTMFAIRNGYTLLELLLSLALTVIVVAGIGMAINVYYNTLVQQQRAIEQELIGRAVLNMLANDLRAGLQYKAADVSGLENLSMSEMMMAGLSNMTGGAIGGGAGDGSEDPAAGGGGTTPAGDTTGGVTGAGGSTTADAGAEAEEDPATQDNAWYRPAFIGLSNQFTLDISRLPRLDQYNTLTTGLESTSTPSDIKRVSWLVSLSPGNPGPNSLDPVGESMGGLYRREVDRAVSAHRKDPDSPSSPDEYTKLLATEVVSMQFRYFDGTEWQSDWDSESIGGYPIAVEILLMIDGDRNIGAASNPGFSSTNINTENLKPYRMVVHLPVAEIIPEEEE